MFKLLKSFFGAFMALMNMNVKWPVALLMLLVWLFLMYLAYPYMRIR